MEPEKSHPGAHFMRRGVFEYMSGRSNQLDVEYKGRTTWNAGLIHPSVCLLGRYVYLPAVAGMHLLQSDDPSGYEITKPECRRHP